MWGGKRALLKNRDRNYTPAVTLVRDVIDGCEVVYMRDDVTGWCEGMNEHGIGITNAALAVGVDEAEGKLVKVTGKTTRDGKRILKALACDNLEDAVESVCEYMNGLKGHTFIATPDKVMCVEQTREHECRVKELNPEDLHVRTNHGHYHTDAGYTEGEDYVSSVIRREKALLTLRDLESPYELGTSLMKARMKDRKDPNNMVRDTNNMSTTSQMVMNLTDREAVFYVIPGKMDYEGVEDNLPDGYSPKIKVKVFSYRNGGKELVELSLKTGLRRKSVDPVKLAARVASRYREANAHAKSIALMKFLSDVARRAGAAQHVYVVGGAVRNFILGVPIKDIDVVVDSVSLGHDSEWFAKRVVREIPAPVNLTTNQYGVVILTVRGEWVLDGINMKGEVIEIANARKESYEGVGGKGKGYKPTDVSPATIEEDVYRREFTFNTLLWRMLDLANGPDKAEVIDITGLGRQHLDEKLIATPVDPDKTFSDDPTRMLRILKFLLRYDLNISPDVVASVKRNAGKLKNMPWEAVANILVGDILKSPRATTGLKVMRSLGLLDVIVEMVKTVPPFSAYLTRELSGGNHSVDVLLDLADIGIAGRVLDFLNPAQQAQFRQNISGWSGDEARRYLEILRKPSLDSMALIQEFSLQKNDRAILIPLAREALLADPTLANQDVGLNDRVREALRGRMSRTAAVPKKYEHIDFKPPQSVADEAEKGLEYREKASPSNKGGLTPAEAAKQGIGSGVQRAVNLKNRDNISPEVIKQMAAFFSRHEKNKGVAPGHKAEPWNDKGNVAWLIWGGDPGRAWAEKVKGQMEAADEKAKPAKKAKEHDLQDVTPVTEYQSPVQVIEAELMVLESLWSDVQAVGDTYASVVHMPHVGRIAGADLALHSQTELFAKCEHAMRHAERVINMCRTQLQLHPGDPKVSSFLRDAQMLYDRFAAGRASAREILSAISQKIVPTALKNIVAEAVDAVKAVTRYPNSVTVKVNSRMAPVSLNNGVVSAQVFDAYVTVYPLPKDDSPVYQQFVFTQCTLGDTSVYLTVIDRTNAKAPAKPVKVADGASAAKKILTALRGWSGLF